ncbi:thrombospondin type 3 repeat-containing protein [Nocardioides sp. WV_118_6]
MNVLTAAPCPTALPNAGGPSMILVVVGVIAVVTGVVLLARGRRGGMTAALVLAALCLGGLGFAVSSAPSADAAGGTCGASGPPSVAGTADSSDPTPTAGPTDPTTAPTVTATATATATATPTDPTSTPTDPTTSAPAGACTAVNDKSPTADTDGDGVADACDVDTDNDGIIDAGNSFGANGLADALETSPESGVLAYTIRNTDGDSTPDFVDLTSAGGTELDLYAIGRSDLDQLGGGFISVGSDPDADGIQPGADTAMTVRGAPGSPLSPYGS